MNKKFLLKFLFINISIILFLGVFTWVGQAQSRITDDTDFFQNNYIYDELQKSNDFAILTPTYSLEGSIVQEPAPRLVLVLDENPSKSNINVPFDYPLSSTKSISSFEINYIGQGEKDVWGNDCFTFPTSAIDAINYSSTIWSSILTINLPIKVQACWTYLQDSNLLGQSGGYTIYRNFPNAPYSNTWYVSSLAKSISGEIISSSVEYDIYITLNSNFTWYYGIDANPPSGTMDLVTVAAHEIGHGLNFFGSANKTGTSGSYGYNGYPFIYDIFVRDGSGNLLTSYNNPSTSLGSLLTSNDLWFHGENAMIGNINNRVKLYAPSTWVGGSSYSHLDYSTFSGTPNSMMVYALSYGSAYHNPGPVTIGLLQDLGWQINNITPGIPTGVSASDGTFVDRVQISWNMVSGATSYSVFRNDENSFIDSVELTNSVNNTSYNDYSAEPGVEYYYFVIACNGSTCSDESNPDTGFRLIGQSVFLPLVVK